MRGSNRGSGRNSDSVSRLSSVSGETPGAGRRCLTFSVAPGRCLPSRRHHCRRRWALTTTVSPLTCAATRVAARRVCSLLHLMSGPRGDPPQLRALGDLAVAQSARLRVGYFLWRGTPASDRPPTSSAIFHVQALVPKGGFEPPRPNGHYALNVARLPFRHFGMTSNAVEMRGFEPLTSAMRTQRSPE